jgi:hypothetical protein
MQRFDYTSGNYIRILAVTIDVSRERGQVCSIYVVFLGELEQVVSAGCTVDKAIIGGIRRAVILTYSRLSASKGPMISPLYSAMRSYRAYLLTLYQMVFFDVFVGK